ncbi:MAG TPA: S8 family serine peptidase [Micromonosporaceae bacterium]
MTTITSYAALAAPGSATAAAPNRNVIVILRDQHTNLQSGRGMAPARVAAAKSDQAPLLAAATKSGARNVHSFSVVNGFAASVSASEAASLAANPAVAGVWPDLTIKATAPKVEPAVKSAAAPQAPVPPTICPSDPSKPLLEPEALQTTHTAFLNPATPQAQNIVDGTGIKVGWIADGIDVNNPDFIRADGTHVITDYQDFSGEGLNAPSDSEESFGDASSIAAQGRQVYDLADYVNAAHPLPAGCTITVRGMAPGASLVGMKVFGDQDTAPTSRFIDAINWAVTVDHVDVLNESFGANPFPDSGNDPITMADQAAVAAGVTVVSDTGDAGTNGPVSSPGDQPGIIGAAGTTTFRSYAQTGEAAFPFGNGTWADNNITSLSGGGTTQDAKVPDIAAPGDLGWALCTPDLTMYQGCTGDNLNPSPIQEFGGTSESTPLVSGAAALVIEAYANTHGGTHPTPALVKQLLMSTATDLDYPAYEQGAGELNALAAVQAAESWKAPKAFGDALLASPGQLSAIGHPAAVVNNKLTVTNDGSHTSTFTATTRTLDPTRLSSKSGSHVLNTATAPTFIDANGVSRSYFKETFTVPHGATRVDAYVASVSPGSPFRIGLIDPHGTFTAFSIPQGSGNWGHADAANPVPGTWTAYFYASTGFAFNDAVHFKFTTQRFTTAGFVTPSHVTLHPGQSTTLTVHSKLGSKPGDVSSSVQLTGAYVHESVPLTQRSLWPTNHKTQSFTGLILGGNGRPQGGAQNNSYYLDVPPGKTDMTISIRLDKDPGDILQAALSEPDGQVVSYKSNLDFDADNNQVISDGLQLNALKPVPGRWVLSLGVNNPVTGLEIQQHFNARLTFDSMKVSAPSLPNSAKTKLAAGVPVQVPVKITNTGAVPQTYFTDARLNQTGTIVLGSISGDDSVTLPVPAGVQPLWLSPPDTSQLSASISASLPTNLNWQFDSGEPQIYGAATGNTAQVTVNAPRVSPGLWFADLGEKGPFGGPPAPAGTASISVAAHSQLFDLDVSSSTTDVWESGAVAQAPDAATLAMRKRLTSAYAARSALDAGAAAAPAANASDDPAPTGPVTLAPGQSVTVMVTITPSGAPGTKVSGHLYIDTFSFFELAGDQTVDLPYSYTVS